MQDNESTTPDLKTPERRDKRVNRRFNLLVFNNMVILFFIHSICNNLAFLTVYSKCRNVKLQ